MSEAKRQIVWIINQYASTPETGIGGRHYYFAQELANMGYEVYLIAASYTHILRSPKKLKTNYQIEKIAEGFNFVWIKMPEYGNAQSKKRIFNWFLFSSKIKRLSQKIDDKPDVILYSSPSLIGFLGAKKLADRLNVRLIFEVRDIWPLSFVELLGVSAAHPFVRFLQWIENKAYKDSHAVISNLKYSVEHMVSHGLERNKFHWIPNGFSQKEVSEKEPLDEYVKKTLPKEKFIVGYTGTLGLAHGLCYLVEAAALLTDYNDIHILIVGKGVEKVRLQKMISDYNLSNISFVEPIKKTQIQSMLAEFDACFLGLTKNSLFRFGVSPNKLFDYLYSAKPIIYSIESGEYHPIESANAGLEVPAQNPEAIKEAIVEIYNMNGDDRNRIGENARAAALKYYEYSKLTKKLVKVLFG